MITISMIVILHCICAIAICYSAGDWIVSVMDRDTKISCKGAFIFTLVIMTWQISIPIVAYIYLRQMSRSKGEQR